MRKHTRHQRIRREVLRADLLTVRGERDGSSRGDELPVHDRAAFGDDTRDEEGGTEPERFVDDCVEEGKGGKCGSWEGCCRIWEGSVELGA